MNILDFKEMNAFLNEYSGFYKRQLFAFSGQNLDFYCRPEVNNKPRKFKTVWHGLWVILKLSGRANQASLKLSAGFSNTVCWTS